jgi:adenosylhomocysteine nucleosidase
MSMPKLAMVAALEREVSPLVEHWKRIEREHEGRKFKFFEQGDAVLVCGGIGGEAARRATEAVIALYQPGMVQSVGFAGALDRSLRVGAILTPALVIDAQDGSRIEPAIPGQGVLVSVARVAGAEQKKRLAKAYGAQSVDMEAAAVAKGARTRGIAFSAVKVISDEIGFELPAMEKFIGRDGQFETGRFVAFVAIRPWLWARVLRLGKNSSIAAQGLSNFLAERLQEAPEPLDNSAAGTHPISKVRA